MALEAEIITALQAQPAVQRSTAVTMARSAGAFVTVVTAPVSSSAECGDLHDVPFRATRRFNRITRVRQRSFWREHSCTVSLGAHRIRAAIQTIQLCPKHFNADVRHLGLRLCDLCDRVQYVR